jgi:MHS family proline/betaine transporter-like MFS transporter
MDDSPTIIDEAVVRRTVIATAMGNAMEWYDFGVYSYLAVVIAKVFFPSSGGNGLIFSLLAFGVAFVIRPIGGVLLGLLGDRIGRQRILSMTIILMAAATFSIGLIPSYNAIGIWSPVLLYVARLLQGLSAGGEYSGASTFISESAPDRRRGFLASFLEFGTVTGFVVGAGLVTILTATLGDAAMQQWGWRIPFLLAGPLGLIGLWLRLHLPETPAFNLVTEEDRDRSAGTRLREVLRQQRRALFLATAVVLALDVTNYLVLSYLPNYLSGTLGYDTTHSLLLTVITMLVMLVAIPIVGHVTDHVGRRPVLAAACVGYIVLSVPALWLMQRGGGGSILLGLMLLGLCQTLFIGTTPSALPEMFPTHHRYSGTALAYNVAGSLFGGTAPLVAAYLVQVTGNRNVPAYYMMLAGLIGLVAVLLTHETSQRPLEGSPPAMTASDAAEAIASEVESNQSDPVAESPRSTPHRRQA